MNPLEYRHPLIHNGTGQQERLAPALLPASLKLDNRTVADHLKFVNDMAGLMAYVNENNQIEGNWQSFFTNQNVAMLGIIVATDLQQYDIEYIQSEVHFWEVNKHAPTGSDSEEEAYQTLINHIYELAVKIQDICTSIPNELALKQEVISIIKSRIGNAIFDNLVQNALSQLIAYDKGAKNSKAFPKRYKDFIMGDHGETACTKAWGLFDHNRDSTWEDAYYCIPPDDSFKEQQPVGECKENRNLRELFIIFYQTLAQIIQRARIYLKKELVQNRAQQPHISLFLSFVFILKYLQYQYNQIPERHLDHYYAEILKLRPLDFTPDNAHVVFQLAKNFEEFVLKAGTLLEAGPDANGNPLRYFVNDELVLNQAEVEELKTFYLKEEDKTGKISLYALPKADSVDGKGAPFFSAAERRFHPLGYVESEDLFGEIGVGISSGLFSAFVTDSSITITFESTGTILNLVGVIDRVFISSSDSPEGWHDVSKKIDITANQLTINFDPTFPVFDLPEESVNPFFREFTQPVLKIMLDPAAYSGVGFDLSLLEISLQVTDSPNFSYLNQITSSFEPYLKPTPLLGQIIEEDSQFKLSGPISILPAGFDPGLRDQLSFENFVLSFEDTDNVGFKELNFDFGIGKSEDDFTLELTPEDVGDRNSIFPRFGNAKISFSIAPSADVLERSVFHITPFGLNRIKSGINLVRLFPPINELIHHKVSSETKVTVDGNLLIGLKNYLPGQAISLLFQILPGTGNPEHQVPDLVWSYLKEKESSEGQTEFYWQEFKPSDIVRDSTKVDEGSAKSLLRSGIVLINGPRDMAGGAPWILTEEPLHWIRVSAAENPSEKEFIDALPELVDIHAQAVLTSFINNGNNLTHLDNGLPKETISKLSSRKTQVKKVEQPYKTFGGRNIELPNEFYRRVSERLRHKNRAINIWDYERLVLQEFPNIRHVKVLSHTSLGNEINPGYVLAVVFPNLTNTSVFSKTSPGLGAEELLKVQDFLKRRTTPFLYCDNRIEVVNPIYELLRVKSCVKFFPAFLPAKYVEILKEDLRTFLAPWAFNLETPIFFSGQFYRSTILNYIEERPYVDKVINFEVFHYTRDAYSEAAVPQNVAPDGNPIQVDQDVILSTTSRSIFTTTDASDTPEEDHEITIWGEGECTDCMQEEFTRFELCEPCSSTLTNEKK